MNASRQPRVDQYTYVVGPADVTHGFGGYFRAQQAAAHHGREQQVPTRGLRDECRAVEGDCGLRVRGREVLRQHRRGERTNVTVSRSKPLANRNG